MPVVRRSLAAAVLLALAVPSAAQATTIAYSPASEQRVLLLLNQIRQRHGLPQLVLSAPLRGSARTHSTGMLERDALQHSALPAAGAGMLKLSGETIAWGVGAQGTPTGIVDQWMRSPPHRAVILARGLRRVGIGIARGDFGGTPDAVMATADFTS